MNRPANERPVVKDPASNRIESKIWTTCELVLEMAVHNALVWDEIEPRFRKSVDLRGFRRNFAKNGPWDLKMV